jgi:predicted SAM-dependent methyltransferase
LSWNQTRQDINPAAAPAISGSMTDMAAVATASVQAVFSSHNIAPLVPYEAPLALAEFLRALDAQGYALITCPDLRSVCVATPPRRAPASTPGPWPASRPALSRR